MAKRHHWKIYAAFLVTLLISISLVVQRNACVGDAVTNTTPEPVKVREDFKADYEKKQADIKPPVPSPPLVAPVKPSPVDNYNDFRDRFKGTQGKRRRF